MIRNILLVAAGGAIGSVCRYLMAGINTASYPWGTLAVNILGALFIGLLTGLVNKDLLSSEMKLLLVTGFCGGLTTFSTFANESFGLLKGGEMLMAAIYAGASITIGIIAVWCGMMLSEFFK